MRGSERKTEVDGQGSSACSDPDWMITIERNPNLAPVAKLLQRARKSFPLVGIGWGKTYRERVPQPKVDQ